VHPWHAGSTHSSSFGLVLAAAVAAHPILDVVVDDEIEFLVPEAVVPREYLVDFVDGGLGFRTEKSDKILVAKRTGENA